MKAKFIRILFVATREASRLFPRPSVLSGDDVKAVEELFDAVWHHFAIVDNPYTEDDIRWRVWDRKACEVIERVKQYGGVCEYTGLELSHV